MSYTETLGRYHLSAESKIENGRPFDTGHTERRDVEARDVKLIGKEANKVGEFWEADPLGDACVEFIVADNASGGLASLAG